MEESEVSSARAATAGIPRQPTKLVVFTETWSFTKTWSFLGFLELSRKLPVKSLPETVSYKIGIL